jgi:hypothetical protein
VGKWGYSDHHDDFANKTDQRLTLMAEAASPTPAGESPYVAELVISCGNQFRGVAKRSILLMSAVPLEFTPEAGNDMGQIDYRFDTDSKPHTHNEFLYDTGHRELYIGDFFGFYFSKGFFTAMLNAKTVRIRVSPLLGDVTETATFDVTGRRAAITQLRQSEWPPA